MSSGDIVVFGQYAGNDKIDVDGEELIILGDIKALLKANLTGVVTYFVRKKIMAAKEVKFGDSARQGMLEV